MYPDHTAPFNRGLRNFLFIFFQTLAISDITDDQTAPSNQGLHDKLFCRLNKHEKNTVMIRS